MYLLQLHLLENTIYLYYSAPSKQEKKYRNFTGIFSLGNKGILQDFTSLIFNNNTHYKITIMRYKKQFIDTAYNCM